MSENCKNYINEYLRPLKTWTSGLDQEEFTPSNIADDSGRNTILISEGKQPMIPRDYQDEAIRRLIFVGNGRGMLDLSTSAGKSFIIANFIWTLHKQYSSELKYLVFAIQYYIHQIL